MLELVLLERTGQCYSHKDMVHRRSLVHKLWRRMLQSQDKVVEFRCGIDILGLLSQIHFIFSAFHILKLKIIHMALTWSWKGCCRHAPFAITAAMTRFTGAVLLARTGQFHNYKDMARSRSLVHR